VQICFISTHAFETHLCSIVLATKLEVVLTTVCVEDMYDVAFGQVVATWLH